MGGGRRVVWGIGKSAGLKNGAVDVSILVQRATTPSKRVLITFFISSLHMHYIIVRAINCHEPKYILSSVG
jgi:hypothetical protein